MITLTALHTVPDVVKGLVRDLRVRWALEEAGLSYREHLVGRDDLDTSAYRALQPFAQVPAIEDDGLRLFESGAIVLHIAEQSAALMPADPAGRARTRAWVFAALNSVEPWVQELGLIDLAYSSEAWAAGRRPGAVRMVEKRFDDLVRVLGDRDFLEDRFSAGDLMMTTVLRILRHTELVSSRPTLAAYQARCESRPAFWKALADHMRPFADAA
jgi:glutathione S-transferase